MRFIETINVSNKKPVSGGSYSSYYRLNKDNGLKVLFSMRRYKNKESLRASNVWRRATSESTMLRRCKERFEFIPTTYGAVIVKCNNYYYAGIKMQHISGKLLFNMFRNEEEDEEKHKIVTSELHKAMKKVGIYHYDLHECNIIFNSKSGHYWVIDFFPEYVELLNAY